MNPLPTGWQVIYQQAHALLAAQLAWAWPAFLPADRWVGLLAAIMQHDDEQAAWHGRGGHHGLTPAGAPANFTQVAFSLEQATGVLHAARFQGRWRSLLTSLHLSTLYEPLRGSNPATTAFLDELRASQSRWLKELHLTKTQARQAYDLLHWCDRLSLILCRQELPEMGRELEIYRAPLAAGRAAHYVCQPDGPGTAVVVRPWPFACKQLAVSVEAQQLHQLQFNDDAELAAALRQAPTKTLSWILQAG
ncbi:DUF3891 family protein [Hymenobacter baengnokdamensis]|uniref:DUF3891 family protein n=1 Tax=Hymenobacter baengnokdamensis TaxID=2615203 RepID=UPI00177B45AD|nr:DUF3891 family protein [Hymenobacter baengnokdamensis]